MVEMIDFTPEKLKKFKKAYQRAVDKKSDIFIFDGSEFVVGYAKYVIEYLDSKLCTVQERGLN
jgi:hypothetical protein